MQGGLGAFIQKKTWALLDQPWQIIQIAPVLHDGEVTGLFKLWVMVNAVVVVVSAVVVGTTLANHPNRPSPARRRSHRTLKAMLLLL